jgi:hypothetical protein
MSLREMENLVYTVRRKDSGDFRDSLLQSPLVNAQGDPRFFVQTQCRFLKSYFQNLLIHISQKVLIFCI